MVHRTHYDIFGFFYPPTFRNWFSDDWLSIIYSEVKSKFHANVRVLNAQPKGTRYTVCTVIDQLSAMINAHKKLLVDWLTEYNKK
jgi:hypothetical protein